MIKLDRKKNNKWILQKNVSSKDLIKAYLNALDETKSKISLDYLKNHLKALNMYKGRSSHGSLSTMGVRFSQMCFYMFGYKDENVFMPSPMTTNILNPNCPISLESNVLVNLFSMQFPNPYSETPNNFHIYMGRLFIKLLLDDKLDKKLYIDEIIWFLPFIQTINQNTYDELIKSILEYRSYDYSKKLDLFKSVDNYEDLFSNVTHEFNYYFLRIFKGFHVLDIIPDKKHNNGNLFKFHHGSGKTYRTDAYDSRKQYSGYVRINEKIFADAAKLNCSFSAFDKPTELSDEDIYSRKDWMVSIYDTEPLKYLSCIDRSGKIYNYSEILKVINDMVHFSKYGSHDGKEFEKSLKPFMKLFKETANVEIISGSGNTDLLCTMEDQNDNFYKMNIEAKTRHSGLEEINSSRLNNHMVNTGAKFCLVVAPRFAKGVSNDIHGQKIITIRADDFAAYCQKDYQKNNYKYADFMPIYEIITNHYGEDITSLVRSLSLQRFGISSL